MALKSYDSQLVVVSLGGVAISGFGDAEKVVVAPVEDLVTVFTGSDSETAVSRNNNPVHTCALNLIQTSGSHNYLSSLVPVVGFTFQVNDLNGFTLVLGRAWITREPDVTLAKTVGVWTWMLGVEVSTKIVGGIPGLPPLP